MDESINEDLEYSNESYQLSMSSIKYSQGAFDTFGKEKQEVMQMKDKFQDLQEIEDDIVMESSYYDEMNNQLPGPNYPDQTVQQPTPPTDKELELQQRRLQNAQKALDKLEKKPERPMSTRGKKGKQTQRILRPSSAKNSNLFTQVSAPKSTQAAPPKNSLHINMQSLVKSASLKGMVSDVVLKKLDPQFQKKKQQIEAQQSQKRQQAFSQVLPHILNNKSRKQQQLQQHLNHEKQLIERERKFRIEQPPKDTKTMPRAAPKVAPQPRSMGDKNYKLHCLAESIPMPYQHRLTAKNIPTMLKEAIRILSFKISEQFTTQEMKGEIEQCQKSIKILEQFETDCKRGEVDLFDQTRKLCNVYKARLELHFQLLQEVDDELTKEIKLREKMNILEPGKAVVKTNKNNFVRAGLLPDSMMSMNTETMTVGDDILKEDPVDQVVYKIEQQGVTVDQLFEMLDIDQDLILTLQEVSQGLKTIKLNLDNDEIQLLVSKLDENSDGVVTKQEFQTLLDPKLRIQQQYRQLVGKIDINNPIEFEEQILDMKLRGRLYNQQMPGLMRKLQEKLPDEKRLVRRITDLSQMLESRQIEINKGFTDKNAINQKLSDAKSKQMSLFQEQKRLEGDHSININSLNKEIQQTLESNAQLEVSQDKYQQRMKLNEDKQKKLVEQEVDLDAKNQFIAAVFLQVYARRYLARRRYKKQLIRTKHAVFVISVAWKKKIESRKRRTRSLRIITTILSKYSDFIAKRQAFTTYKANIIVPNESEESEIIIQDDEARDPELLTYVKPEYFPLFSY